MAISNAEGHLLLTTGNKSELEVGNGAVQFRRKKQPAREASSGLEAIRDSIQKQLQTVGILERNKAPVADAGSERLRRKRQTEPIGDDGTTRRRIARPEISNEVIALVDRRHVGAGVEQIPDDGPAQVVR